MAHGKKIAIALAIAIPLLVLGAGLALADISPTQPAAGGQQSVVVPTLVQVASQGVALEACDGCTGPCNGGTECTGVCAGECPRLSDGACIGGCAGGDSGQCYGSGSCAGAKVASRGCGMRGAAGNSGSACTSCDVVGLNEYPINSPRYQISA